jgi:hypothetical protein
VSEPVPVRRAGGAVEIRPLETADLLAVAGVVQRAFRPACPEPRPQLVEYLSRTLLEPPSAHADLPSLVAQAADGRIVGFVAAMFRPMRYDGRPVRMVVSSHLSVEPDARKLAVGALLLRRLLSGPQDVTVTDTATPTVCRIWERLGGETLHLQCLHWIRVFAPAKLALARHARRRGWRTPHRAQLVVRPLDAAFAAVDRGDGDPPDGIAEPLTAAALVQTIPVVGKGLAVLPDYDVAFADALLEELDLLGDGGTGVRKLVRGSDGRLAGWYVYYLRRSGLSEVMQIAARPRDVKLVVDHLFHDARVNGAAGLIGRVEPRLVEAVAPCLIQPRRSPRCLIVYGAGALIHAREPGIVAAVRAGDTLLSRLDGEWWSHVPLDDIRARHREERI